MSDILQLESVTEASPRPNGKAQGLLVSSDLLAVSYGMGDNSTALLCGLREREIKPDLITTADPKGEHEHSYAALEMMRGKVREWWGMDITIVRKLYQGKHEGLEAECVRRSMLPGLAYGTRSCSIKHKGEPQDKELERELKRRGIPWTRCPSSKKLKLMCLTKEEWCDANGVIPAARKAIGYHADEPQRAKRRSARPELFLPWYPLIEWQWHPCECIHAMRRHGIKPPGKSACFFCPAMKRSEVVQLAKERPDLIERALAMERAAQATNTTKRGLGGEGNLWAD